jgi:hypothetical protein
VVLPLFSQQKPAGFSGSELILKRQVFVAPKNYYNNSCLIRLPKKVKSGRKKKKMILQKYALCTLFIHYVERSNLQTPKTLLIKPSQKHIPNNKTPKLSTTESQDKTHNETQKGRLTKPRHTHHKVHREIPSEPTTDKPNHLEPPSSFY